MKVACKNCLPKEGIQIPSFSQREKEKLWLLKNDSPIRTVKRLIEEHSFSHRDAKFIVTHINIKYGKCNRCKSKNLDREYIECPKCGSLNFNWENIENNRNEI